MNRILAAAGALALAVFATPLPAADSPPASGAPEAGMWDLRDLYPSAEAWSAAYAKARAHAATLDRYKGTLGKSAASMLKALTALSDANREATRLAVYASLKGDEDVRV